MDNGMGSEQELNEFQRLESLWQSIEKMVLKVKGSPDNNKNIETNSQIISDTFPDELSDTKKIIPFTDQIAEDLKKDSDFIDTVDLNNKFDETEQIKDFSPDEIEELSMDELAFLSSKIEKPSPNSLTYENPDDLQKMILVETSEGLNVGMALPIELTDYKPDFLVTASGTNSKNETEKTEKKRTFAEKFYFYEDGSFLGMTVGESGKADVLRIMREFGSKVFKPKDTAGKNYFFDELSLSVLFDDNGLVKELTIGGSFQGQTSKGLRMGEHIEKVFEIYGKPEKITPIGFEWGNFSIFHKNNLVTHFRLKS